MAANVMKLSNIDYLFKGERMRIDLLRCDLFEPAIPGNKYWKMKYNIEEMTTKGIDHLVTFGGAFSNHIAAVAEAGKKYGFKTTGIIRGEESSRSNATLKKAEENGMNLRFIDRENYRNWKQGKVDLSEFLDFADFYLLPEGGSNTLAVKGCSEIMGFVEEDYDVVCCGVGTGSTLAGIIASSKVNQQVLGFSSLKGGEYLKNEIQDLLKSFDATLATKENWKLIHDYHFGGFARATSELIEFFKDFKQSTNIELDLIYTSKMMYGLLDMIREGRISKNAKILAIHTGGQQGNESMLKRHNQI